MLALLQGHYATFIFIKTWPDKSLEHHQLTVQTVSSILQPVRLVTTVHFTKREFDKFFNKPIKKCDKIYIITVFV